MDISKKTVAHIADLAELSFDDKELEMFSSQLTEIIRHVATIAAIDTKGINPTSHVIISGNVLREDVQAGSLSKKDALKNAPAEMDGGFKVPKID
jgi:aspartyl-tRNA(Asn)/glutamyl-tRNA(Gln) amidotransferase subunit C